MAHSSETLVVTRQRVLGAKHGTLSERKSNLPPADKLQPPWIGDSPQEACDEEYIDEASNSPYLQPYLQCGNEPQGWQGDSSTGEGEGPIRSQNRSCRTGDTQSSSMFIDAEGTSHLPTTLAAILSEFDDDDSEPSTPESTPSKDFEFAGRTPGSDDLHNRSKHQKGAAETLADILSELDDDDCSCEDEGYSGQQITPPHLHNAPGSPALTVVQQSSRGSSPIGTRRQITAVSSGSPLRQMRMESTTSRGSPVSRQVDRGLLRDQVTHQDRPRTAGTESPYRHTNQRSHVGGHESSRPSTATATRSPLSRQPLVDKDRIDAGIARLASNLASPRRPQVRPNPQWHMLADNNDDDIEPPPVTAARALTTRDQRTKVEAVDRPSTASGARQRCTRVHMIPRSNTTSSPDIPKLDDLANTSPDFCFRSANNSPDVGLRSRAPGVVAAARRASACSSPDMRSPLLALRLKSLSSTHPPANASPRRSMVAPRGSPPYGAPGATSWQVVHQHLHDLPKAASSPHQSPPLPSRSSAAPHELLCSGQQAEGSTHRNPSRSPVRGTGLQGNRDSPRRMKGARVGDGEEWQQGVGEGCVSLLEGKEARGMPVGHVQRIQMRQQHLKARQNTAPEVREVLRGLVEHGCEGRNLSDPQALENMRFSIRNTASGHVLRM